ncbi:epoxide hydrolase 4-like [Dendronephthya gigantea]|uniref:epoxide hydrolase 4-like n=1 Tax=Dendronephthya gigantea TaxID=151771 RepID=UPI00106A5397|nr:epoxide hydrolase 4-like [Dendronephthya gigantea]
MANLVFRFIKFAVLYSLAGFYGFFVSLFLLGKLCQLRMSFFKKRQGTQVPACLQDSSLGDHHYITTKSGHKFHYVAKGNPGKPLMLCLHGFPEFWFSWRFQLKEFCDDYRVVALDLRGYGDSYQPKGISNYAQHLLVQDVEEVIEALGYSSCVLLGHDWGGVIAWNFVQRYSEIVDKLVIMNSPHPIIFLKYLRSNWSQFFRSWYIFLNVLPYLPEVLYSYNDCVFMDDIFVGEAWTDEIKDAFKYSFSKPGASTAGVNYYRCSLLYGDEPQPWKRKLEKTISMPTLVVWGDKDKALDISLLNDLDHYVKNLTVRIVEGATHWVQQDKPDVVNRHVREFLKAC